MFPVVPMHRLPEEMRIEVVQGVMQGHWVSGSQHFKGSCCLLLQGRADFFDYLKMNEGNTFP